jgi:hypothetical protein
VVSSRGALEFFFETNVATAPTVYISTRPLDYSQATSPANRKFVVAFKASPLSTSHKIRVDLPKRDATYYFLIAVSYNDPVKNKSEFITIWSDKTDFSTPKSL